MKETRTFGGKFEIWSWSTCCSVSAGLARIISYHFLSDNLLTRWVSHCPTVRCHLRYRKVSWTINKITKVRWVSLWARISQGEVDGTHILFHYHPSSSSLHTSPSDNSCTSSHRTAHAHTASVSHHLPEEQRIKLYYRNTRNHSERFLYHSSSLHHPSSLHHSSSLHHPSSNNRTLNHASSSHATCGSSCYHHLEDFSHQHVSERSMRHKRGPPHQAGPGPLTLSAPPATIPAFCIPATPALPLAPPFCSRMKLVLARSAYLETAMPMSSTQILDRSILHWILILPTRVWSNVSFFCRAAHPWRNRSDTYCNRRLENYHRKRLYSLVRRRRIRGLWRREIEWQLRRQWLRNSIRRSNSPNYRLSLELKQVWRSCRTHRWRETPLIVNKQSSNTYILNTMGPDGIVLSLNTLVVSFSLFSGNRQQMSWANAPTASTTESLDSCCHS